MRTPATFNGVSTVNSYLNIATANSAVEQNSDARLFAYFQTKKFVSPEQSGDISASRFSCKVDGEAVKDRQQRVGNSLAVFLQCSLTSEDFSGKGIGIES